MVYHDGRIAERQRLVIWIVDDATRHTVYHAEIFSIVLGHLNTANIYIVVRDSFEVARVLGSAIGMGVAGIYDVFIICRAVAAFQLFAPPEHIGRFHVVLSPIVVACDDSKVGATVEHRFHVGNVLGAEIHQFEEE